VEAGRLSHSFGEDKSDEGLIATAPAERSLAPSIPSGRGRSWAFIASVNFSVWS
jgi:hypothetical protein